MTSRFQDLSRGRIKLGNLERNTETNAVIGIAKGCLKRAILVNIKPDGPARRFYVCGDFWRENHQQDKGP